jgi:two-component system, NarL family, sensor histidine kinase DegS
MKTRTMAADGQAEPDVATPERTDAMSVARLEAHEEERARLAEELHDGPAQVLANAIFQTELAERALRDDVQAAAAELARLREMLQRELETLRAYISQMRPQLHEPDALEQALHDAASTLTEYTGIPVDVRIEAPGEDLEEPARNVVLRVAQEALRNIGKHSAAARAWLATRETDSSGRRIWELEVGDDGRGIESAPREEGQRRRHFGLRFMRERANLLGADLVIEPGPAAVGTIVRLRIDTAGERR